MLFFLRVLRQSTTSPLAFTCKKSVQDTASSRNRRPGVFENSQLRDPTRFHAGSRNEAAADRPRSSTRSHRSDNYPSRRDRSASSSSPPTSVSPSLPARTRPRRSTPLIINDRQREKLRGRARSRVEVRERLLYLPTRSSR